MSNPDQPSTPPLTRRQMRDLRNTGIIPAGPDPAVWQTPHGRETLG